MVKMKNINVCVLVVLFIFQSCNLYKKSTNNCEYYRCLNSYKGSNQECFTKITHERFRFVSMKTLDTIFVVVQCPGQKKEGYFNTEDIYSLEFIDENPSDTSIYWFYYPLSANSKDKFLKNISKKNRKK